MKPKKYWTIAISVQLLLLVIPMCWMLITNPVELEIKQNYCIERYSEIFQSEGGDFVNIERATEDQISTNSAIYSQCERAISYPGYWSFMRAMNGLLIGLGLQMFWMLWGTFYMTNDIY